MSNPLTHPNTPIGFLSNGGSQRYLLEAESTTGFTAWQLADGTILVTEAEQVSLKNSDSVRFWACAGYKDSTPAGKIISFDCHGNDLTKLDVTALTGLEFLDCSFNQLTSLPLDGLIALEALDADNNHLTRLEVRQLHSLRVLNCANNRLAKLDVSGLSRLEVLDCSGNHNLVVKAVGCDVLKKSDPS